MADTPRTLRRTRTSGDLTLTLAAGEYRKVPRWGRSYTCLSVTTDNKVVIGLNQAPVDALIKGIGDAVAYDEPDFSELEFQNNDTGPQTVTLRTSFGVVADNRLNLVGGTIAATTNATATLTTPALETVNTGANSDKAANANRKSLTIYHNTAGATIWFCAPATAVNAGIPIGPGNVFSAPDNFTGAYRLRNASGVNITDLAISEFT